MAWKGDSMTVTATNGSAEFEPHPDGQFVARCVDCIDLGENVEQYADFPPKLVRKVALVYVTGEAREFNGEMELIPLVKEFSVSFGEKAGLRKWCEASRGRSYKTAEIEGGIALDKMVGLFFVVNVEHKLSKKGRTYANILSIGPVMKGVAKPEHLGTEYERPKFLTDKKAQYADAAKKFRAEMGMPVNGQASKGRSSEQPAPGFDAPLPPEPDYSAELPF